jgi:glycosyltransferase involved in cell wall biosynthesis
MRKDRALHIVIPVLSYYPDHPSGAARLAFDEAVFLANLGHKVWVVTSATSMLKPEYSFEDGLHVLRYPGLQMGSLDPRRVRVHQKRTRSFLHRYVGQQVDLIHGHSLLQYDGALSLYGNQFKRCYSVHSPVFKEIEGLNRGMNILQRVRAAIAARLLHQVERRCLSSSDCILAFSEYTRSLLGQLHGKHIQQRTQIIPGWVDLNKFQVVEDRRAVKSQLGWPTDVPLFFTLRRLIPRMGLDRLLYAAAKVKSLGWEFCLVIGGGGPLREALEELARDLGLLESVRFLGVVSDDALPLMYAAADSFVLPTAELECFGLITLEALACGRPVLATPVGAIPEVLNGFEPAWLAPDTSVDAIAQLLIDFLKGALPIHDPNVLREKVTERYSRESVLQRLVAVMLDT